jgi:NIMA (never in mitosis gene a)-related kinase
VKLGDFGVSRVLKNTHEFASTQIGTPYYMSPEIMNNKKYNSKTDIWSLGCILFELICLKLPFEGKSMKQLCQNILHGSPIITPSTQYSLLLRELVKELLLKNPQLRPGINAILSRPVIKDRISGFLDATKKQREFSHTVIHGMQILHQAPPTNLPETPKGGPIGLVAGIPSRDPIGNLRGNLKINEELKRGEIDKERERELLRGKAREAERERIKEMEKVKQKNQERALHREQSLLQERRREAIAAKQAIDHRKAIESERRRAVEVRMAEMTKQKQKQVLMRDFQVKAGNDLVRQKSEKALEIDRIRAVKQREEAMAMRAKMELIERKGAMVRRDAMMAERTKIRLEREKIQQDRLLQNEREKAKLVQNAAKISPIQSELNQVSLDDQVEEQYQHDLKVKQQQFHARVRRNSEEREARNNPLVQPAPTSVQNDLNSEKTKEEGSKVDRLDVKIKGPLIKLQTPRAVHPPVHPPLPVPPSIVVSLDSGETLDIYLFHICGKGCNYINIHLHSCIQLTASIVVEMFC